MRFGKVKKSTGSDTFLPQSPPSPPRSGKRKEEAEGDKEIFKSAKHRMILADILHSRSSGDVGDPFLWPRHAIFALRLEPTYTSSSITHMEHRHSGQEVTR